MKTQAVVRGLAALGIVTMVTGPVGTGVAQARTRNSGARTHRMRRRAASRSGNIAKVRAFVDQFFNKGHYDSADRYLSPHYVDHNPFPGQPNTLAGFKQGCRDFRAAFPDLHLTIHDIMASGNKVIIRGTISGTNTGPFMGAPATGKRIKVTGIDIVRFAHGKAVEHWGNDDDAGMMQQLGFKMVPPGAGK